MKTEELSEDYNVEMQEKMKDDSLIYRHEHGMNYAHLTDDLIVGSCLQTPEDVDKCDMPFSHSFAEDDGDVD